MTVPSGRQLKLVSGPYLIQTPFPGRPRSCCGSVKGYHSCMSQTLIFFIRPIAPVVRGWFATDLMLENRPLGIATEKSCSANRTLAATRGSKRTALISSMLSDGQGHRLSYKTSSSITCSWRKLGKARGSNSRFLANSARSSSCCGPSWLEKSLKSHLMCSEVTSRMPWPVSLGAPGTRPCRRSPSMSGWLSINMVFLEYRIAAPSLYLFLQREAD